MLCRANGALVARSSRVTPDRSGHRSKTFGVPQGFRMLTQDPDALRVKGANRRLGSFVPTHGVFQNPTLWSGLYRADQLTNTLLHFSGGFVGEGDRQNAFRDVPFRIKLAIRKVTTRVLPVPAPASTKRGPPSVATASACGPLSPCVAFNSVCLGKSYPQSPLS